MRRTACALLILATLGGCVSTGHKSHPSAGGRGRARHYPKVPHVQGPWGQPVKMIEPYSYTKPGEYAAMQMMNHSVPLNMVQFNNSKGPVNSGVVQAGYQPQGNASGIRQAQAQMPAPPGGSMPNIQGPQGAMLSPPGVPFAPGMQGGGMMKGPMVPFGPGPKMPIPGAVAAVGAGLHHGPQMGHGGTHRTQVRFVSPAGMKVSWFTMGPNGPDYSQNYREVPGRYNFTQAAIYRLKLSNIPGFPGLEVYPTIEVVPALPKTTKFLSHCAVPIAFTQEDIRQVSAGNYMVKVIYLPDSEYQDLAITGPNEIVSTQLEPGADPIKEADRRGTIMMVIRMGNLDEEAPNTPAINAPPSGTIMHPGHQAQRMPQGGPQGQMPQIPQAGMIPNMPMPGNLMPTMQNTPPGFPIPPMTPGTGLPPHPGQQMSGSQRMPRLENSQLPAPPSNGEFGAVTPARLPVPQGN